MYVTHIKCNLFYRLNLGGTAELMLRPFLGWSFFYFMVRKFCKKDYRRIIYNEREVAGHKRGCIS